MRSPQPSTVLIECPHCGTRYQVPMETIGPRGRQVQCAHCSGAWQAVATDGSETALAVDEDAADRLFDETAERELDAAFAAEEQAAAAETEQRPAAAVTDEGQAAEAADANAAPPAEQSAPRADTAGDRKRAKAFSRRQDTIARKLPLARVRRVVRLVSLGLLVSLLIGFVVFRTEIVRGWPDLAGAYEAIGLGVNVVGLEFKDFTTVVALQDGARVLRVDARIDNITGRNLPVPPVAVSLLNATGDSLYEWSVRPEARDLEPGEAVEFSTQLRAPPADAAQVRISFASSGSQPQSSLTPLENGSP